MILVRVALRVAEPVLAAALAEAARRLDASVDLLDSEKMDWAMLQREGGDLLVVSEKLLPASPLSDIEALRRLCHTGTAPAVVLVVDAEDADRRAQLLAAGCEAVLYGGLRPDRLAAAFSGILERLRQEHGTRPERLPPPPHLADLVTESPNSKAFVELVSRVKDSDVSLLIQGETGAGKEWLARSIHNDSHRSHGPFVALNCSAVPEHLLESELFGHVEGAFTGASRSRRGWFELAHRGTLFLDEIGDMPLHLQVKLLRVLQEHQVQPLGSERAVAINVRVVAATNRNLLEDVDAGRFRRDLYYRLSPVILTIPPLRERREDIPRLVNQFLDALRPRVKRPVHGITPRAMSALVEYDWPGNVRELINVLERAMLLSEHDEIGIHDLPESVARGVGVSLMQSDPAVMRNYEQWRGKSWREAAEEVRAEWEPHYLSALLQETQGRIGETARRAGLTPRSVYNKMRQYNLDKSRFR